MISRRQTYDVNREHLFETVPNRQNGQLRRVGIKIRRFWFGNLFPEPLIPNSMIIRKQAAPLLRRFGRGLKSLQHAASAAGENQP